MPYSFFIDNLGCAKNQVDAEIIISALESSGWNFASEAERADLIIVNSCGFIASAKEESIGAAIEARGRFPDKKILLAGCLAQRYGSVLMRELPEVDGIFGNRVPERIVEVARRVAAGERVLLIPGDSRVEAADGGAVAAPTRRRLLSFPGSAYVKIAEGCSNRCTYCAIPLIRGDLASRPIADVVEEVGRFAGEGEQEIILVAQDSATYGKERTEGGLRALLERLRSIPGDFWIRLLYFHPDHFDPELLAFFRDGTRLLPYFDLPFQHAARQVLRRMGRTGSAGSYLDLIRRIRAELPDAVIRSTFLVGFPGEGHDELEELLAFQEEARLDWMGVFAYSREEGTAAYRMRVPSEKRARRAEALRRKRLLEKRQTPITEERLERFVSRRMDVLIEERVAGSTLYLGRGYPHSPEVDGAVVVDAPSQTIAPGARVECTVARRNGIDLEAKPLRPAPGSS